MEFDFEPVCDQLRTCLQPDSVKWNLAFSNNINFPAKISQQLEYIMSQTELAAVTVQAGCVSDQVNYSDKLREDTSFKKLQTVTEQILCIGLPARSAAVQKVSGQTN